MTKKKSLVVDDSKSARFALKRMLTELGLDVDTVDSAQDALDYLEENHPDVIFMDHMMPGMDGFEAVKRIKSNAQTAVIPILMYTTKGSELYLSQARALGVVGIIPKTIAPVELKASLFELGLIDNNKMESSLKLAVPKGEEGRADKKQDAPGGLQAKRKKNVLDIYVEDLRKLMDDQTVELHRSMWLGVESVSNEIFNRLNTELNEKIDKINVSNERLNTPVEPVHIEAPRWPLYVVSALLVISLMFNFILMRDDEAEPAQQTTVAKEPGKQSAVNSQNNKQKSSKVRWNFIQWALSRIIKYPYDELALNEKRAVRINEVIGKALESNYKGRIVFQSHVGEFCFTSDQSGNYNLAKNDLPVTKCDFIGNYMQPDDHSTTHQSLFFVNFLSDLYALEDKGIVVDVQSIPRSVHASNYPPQVERITAGEWNKAAQLNNHITVKLEPAENDFM